MLFAAVGSWIGRSVVTAIRNSGKTDEKVLSEQWVKKTYGSYGLTLETPWELQPAQSPLLQQNIKDVIEKLESYETGDNNHFKVGVNSIKCTPAVGELSLQGGADGAVNEMRNAPGVTDFIYNEDSYSISGLPGFIQRGTFSQDGHKIAFINIGAIKDYNLWQVMVLRGKDDDIASKAAERIIESIQIDY